MSADKVRSVTLGAGLFKKSVSQGASNMSERSRVLIVDDHALFRSGLKLIIKTSNQFKVVEEAADGSDIVALVQRSQPDILVMDVSMPKVSGVEALALVQAACPALPVVMLSMHTRPDIVRQCLDRGASGYLLKDASESELILALEAARNGQRYLSPTVTRALFASQQGRQNRENQLTERQEEILRLIALGKGTKQIAYDLGLSVKTVETHRAHLMQRLRIFDVPGLVKYAINQGLIELPVEPF